MSWRFKFKSKQIRTFKKMELIEKEKENDISKDDQDEEDE